MYHVIGLSHNLILHAQPFEPLEIDGRLRFSTRHQQANGYFRLIAPHFEAFAMRDSAKVIGGLHVVTSLSGHDLHEALSILDQIEKHITALPPHWRSYLGTTQRGNGAVQRMEPLLFNSRALRIVLHLRMLVVSALKQGKSVCYGSGAVYRAYCGIRLKPGEEYYS